MVSTDVTKTVKNVNLKDNNLGQTHLIPLNLAVVVDVISNENHIKLQDQSKPLVNPQHLPLNYNGDPANVKDVDYSYVGRAKVRILSQEKKTPKEKLPWAIPLDQTISQYPLVNELVVVQKIGDTYYYSKPFNRFNFPNNIDYSVETVHSEDGKSAVPFFYDGQRQTYTSAPIYSKYNNLGFVGDYFILNNKIRNVVRYEGDTVIESRFGQSIRMATYDENRLNDRTDLYDSYTVDKKLTDSKNGGYGNPMIIIRNRQRNLARNFPTAGLHRKLPKIPKIKDFEKNYGGQIEEDINNDGSTIAITSGVTISKFVTSVYKSIFGRTENLEPTEEQVKYNPPNSTNFSFPTLTGDQIIINTDRLVLQSRLAETIHFSKKRYAVATDSEYTVDANDQIVLTTNNLTCLNSPQIFLGQYGETNEPALLGQTTVDWLYDLCNWILDHVHWYHHVHPYPHSHPDAGGEGPANTIDAVPDQTQIPVQQIKLRLLRDSLHKTLSRRVYLTGGGYAPGSDGVKPIGSEGDCKDPVQINTVTGQGVVGDFKGRNRREGPVQIEFEFEN
jgi:hypothetical protein